jgi:hypothetical protein
MRFRSSGALVRSISWPLALPAGSAPMTQPIPAAEDLLVTSGEIGSRGGHRVAALRPEPKTLNAVTGVDLPAKELIGSLLRT